MCHPLLMIKYSMSILTFGDVIMNKPFIAIEGPIGVGKSSLLIKLAKPLIIMKKMKSLMKTPFSLIL